MKKIFNYLLLAFSCVVGNVHAQPWMLSADTWATPRSAQGVAKIPAVKEAMQVWQQKTNHKIELLFPGGEEGDLWASELKDWMISLGIPSQDIITNSGSGTVDHIRIDIRGSSFE